MSTIRTTILLLLLLLLMSTTGLFSSNKILSGGSYEISNVDINKNSGVDQELEGGGYSLKSSIGQSLGNIEVSSDEYSIASIALELLANTRPAAIDLTIAHVYPNPFRKSQGHVYINFTRLEEKVEIRIYTISGELVTTLYKDDISTDEIIWDLTNDAGQQVFSGIYLYFIKSNNNTKKGKLMIIK